MRFVNQPCPLLPECPESGSHRLLSKFGESRDGEFFIAALTYAQFLWCAGHPARSILALCRAFYAARCLGEQFHGQHPLPYQAYAWLITQPGATGFFGNPRVSFQHQATRMPPNKPAFRQIRATALWHLTRTMRPDLPGDPDEREPLEPVSAVIHSLDVKGAFGEADELIVSLSLSGVSPDRASRNSRNRNS